MGFWDDFLGEAKKLANTQKDVVNGVVGSDYARIYFSSYPDRYHYCKCCGRELDREVPGEVTIDHIIPKSLGGTNAISNLQVLCRSCNARKKDKIQALSLKYSGAALIREIKRMFD